MHLTRPLLQHEFGSLSRAPCLLYFKSTFSRLEHPDERIVVIPTILDHPVNISYETSHKWSCVKSVNGVKVRNVKHVMELIEEAKTKHIRVDCVENGPIVLDKKLAEKANKEIMRTHSVFSLKSRDLGGELPGEESKKEDEEVGIHTLLEDFGEISSLTDKFLTNLGLPKNAAAAKVVAEAGGPDGIVNFLTRIKGTLD